MREAAGERGSSTSASHGSTTWWSRPGLPARLEQSLNYIGAGILALLVAGWAWSIGHAMPLAAAEANGLHPQAFRAGAAAITSALTNINAPTTAYLTGA